MMAREIERMHRDDLDALIAGYEMASGMSSELFLERRRAGLFSFQLDYQMWAHLLACRELMDEDAPQGDPPTPL